MTNSVRAHQSFARVELANRKAELAEQLIEAFEQTGMKSYGLGPYCGVSSKTIDRIVNKKGKGITIDLMYLIAVSLGLSVNMKVINVNQ